MEKDTYLSLGLLPDENVVYRERVGLLSVLGFIGFIPQTYSVVTTKRCFVVRPFVGKRSIPYEKISSMNVKKGFVTSRLIIDIKENGATARAIIAFSNASKAMAAFSTISNQITASKDPIHHRARESHRRSIERMESIGPRQLRQVPAPVAASSQRTMVAGMRVAASVIDKAVRLKDFIETDGREGMAAVMNGAQKAWPVLNAAMNSVLSSARKRMSDVIPLLIARKQQKTASLEPALYLDDAEIAYFSGGEPWAVSKNTIESSGDAVFIPEGNQMHAQTVQIQKQHRKKGGIDPDRDLKIFRVRRLRASGGKHIPKEKPSLFNIFNGKT